MDCDLFDGICLMLFIFVLCCLLIFYVGLIVVNVVVWLWVFVVLCDYLLLFGIVVIVYGFGLCYVVDVDYIVVIDVVMCKLMQDGQCLVSVGLFFLFGYLMIVIVVMFGIVLIVFVLCDWFDVFCDIGGMIGMVVLVMFLLVFVCVNLMILCDVW